MARSLLRVFAAVVVALGLAVPQLSFAAEDHPKSGAGDFEHVRALAIDGEGRTAA